MADGLSLPARLIEKGLGLFDRYSSNARNTTNRRLFLETVLDNKREDITEKDFSDEEQAALKRLILKRYESANEPAKQYLAHINAKLAQHEAAIKAKNKDRQLYPEFLDQYKKDKAALDNYFSGKLTKDFLDIVNPKEGKQPYPRAMGMRDAMVYFDNVRPFVGYAHYPIDQNAARTTDKASNPYNSLATTLGQFRFDVDRDGNLFVKDQYDFNPPSGMLSGQSMTPTATFDDVEGAMDGGGTGIYRAIRMYAGEKVPPGKGRAVNVRLPSDIAAELQERLKQYETQTWNNK